MMIMIMTHSFHNWCVYYLTATVLFPTEVKSDKIYLPFLT